MRLLPLAPLFPDSVRLLPFIPCTVKEWKELLPELPICALQSLSLSFLPHHHLWTLDYGRAQCAREMPAGYSSTPVGPMYQRKGYEVAAGDCACICTCGKMRTLAVPRWLFLPLALHRRHQLS